MTNVKAAVLAVAITVLAVAASFPIGRTLAGWAA